MNPLQLRQTTNHHLNQLSLIHLQTVVQMVAYLAEHERSLLNQPVRDGAEVIQMIEPQTFNLGQTQEMTWEQWRTTMSPFAPSQLESPAAPPIYQGKPLSLEEMDRVIQIEAGKRK